MTTDVAGTIDILEYDWMDIIDGEDEELEEYKQNYKVRRQKEKYCKLHKKSFGICRKRRNR